MATFSKTTFDAAAYLAFRPSYPKWVSDKLLTYHFGRHPSCSPSPSSSSAGSSLALDLGCGPGISTLSLLAHFDRVIGLDPSSKMVDAAITPTTANLPRHLVPSASDGIKGKLGTVEYKQGYSEELSLLSDESVDLVTSGQAAHWFDYPRFWKELTRIVKPGGSVCLYGYPDFFLPDFPSTRSLLNRFALKDGRGPGSPRLSPTYPADEKIDGIGEYWEQPGRSIVNQGLEPIPFPHSYPDIAPQWDSSTALKRTFSTAGLTWDQIWSSWPPLTTSPLNADGLTQEVRKAFEGEQKEATMDKHLTWDQLGSYLRTWTATHAYLTEHKGDKEEHAGKDVVDRFLEKLKKEVERANGGQEVQRLHLRWPLCFVMVKKMPL
ncbi:related to TMT1-trans-aconitate methyltransferase [Ustilago bromivora]|uniref:Related to TMT1 - trans-aconitate methyltransferase n=1 Tax=Ustilago bromivora TaxID=307758 RepID=A0A1K0G6I2_9BASI|nr:related to TMT1-trans-aconitate methyltransferase [Ustilago bromivora]SYW75546.1 related to TMT1 - trans-aconitate methyltransferase [Ustilago bromivora]